MVPGTCLVAAHRCNSHTNVRERGTVGHGSWDRRDGLTWGGMLSRDGTVLRGVVQRTGLGDKSEDPGGNGEEAEEEEHLYRDHEVL